MLLWSTGSRSGSAFPMRIRIQLTEINADPDPKHCLKGLTKKSRVHRFHTGRTRERPESITSQHTIGSSQNLFQPVLCEEEKIKSLIILYLRDLNLIST